MKYFIVCKLADPILDSEELRQAVFREMENVNSQWEKPRLYELEETSPRFFNSNMELYYDTHDLKWVFVDRRREYVDDSFTIRLNQDRMTSRQMRFIRPYQVMASCVMMYRWLVLFKYMFTEDVGLAFYRIWRFRLKHSETGFIFETYDWKAAMSSTFSHGCPLSKKFRDDGLAILNMLSSPFFVTHPLGSMYKICYEVSFPVYSESVFSSENVSRSSSVETLDSIKSEPKQGEYLAMPKMGECSVSPLFTRKAGESSTMAISTPKGITKSFSSDTLSSLSGRSTNDEDQESEDNGEDYGYFCNCEHFIHRSSWEYEEQQMIQAEVAAKWETILDHPQPTFELVFDSYEEKWLFYCCAPTSPKNPDKLNRQVVEKSLESAKHIRDGPDANESAEVSSASAQLETSDLETNAKNGSGVSKFPTLPVTQASNDTEQSNLSLSQEAMPSSLTLYRLICLFDLASPQYKSSEESCVWSVCLQHRLTRGTIQLKDLNGMYFCLLHEGRPTFYIILVQTGAVKLFHASTSIKIYMFKDIQFILCFLPGWLRVFATLSRELRLYCSDLAIMQLNQNIGFLEDNKNQGCSSNAKPDGLSSTSSDNDSIVSLDGSSEDEFGNPLERFKQDTCALLQLLVNQKFAHPYGTVAGAVA